MQVTRPLFEHLRDGMLQHLRDSTAHPLCGRLIQIDGHAKVFRSHCRYKEVESERPRRVSFTASLRKFCSATPLPGKGGFCKVMLHAPHSRRAL